MDMKINQMLPTQSVSEHTDKAQPVDDQLKFTLMSRIDDEGLQERLNLMFQDITMQGKKIGKHMDVRDMKRYRALIKDFLNEVVNRSHKFSRENFLDRRGEELMKEEKDHLAILSRIDEIKGMLLDIFT